MDLAQEVFVILLPIFLFVTTIIGILAIIFARKNTKK